MNKIVRRCAVQVAKRFQSSSSSLAAATGSAPSVTEGVKNVGLSSTTNERNRRQQKERLEKSQNTRESNRVPESREETAGPTRKILAKKPRLTSLQEYQRDPREVKTMQGHVLAAAVAASGAAKIMNPCLWEAYAKRTKEVHKMFSARSCVLIARGFALAGQRDLDVFEALSNRLLDTDKRDIWGDHENGRLKTLDSSQLVLLVTALSRLDVYDGPLLVGIAKEIKRAHLITMDPRGLGAFVQGYAALGAAGCVPKPNFFWKDIARVCIPKLQDFDIGAVALLAHGFSLLGHRYDPFLEAVATYIPEFEASGLSYMVNAMARLNWQTKEAVEAIQDRIEEVDGYGVPSKPTDIAQMMSGLGRLNVPLSERAYSMLATAAMRQASELSGPHLAMLFMGLVRLTKNLANKMFGYLARFEENVCIIIDPSKSKFWAQI